MERRRLVPSDSVYQAILAAMRAYLSQLGEVSLTIPPLDTMLGLEKMLAGTLKPLPDVMRSIGLQTPDAIRSTKSIMERYNDRNRWMLGLMASHGWYLDPSMRTSYLVGVAERLSQGQRSEVDAELCDYFDSRAGDLKSELSDQFPERARLFSAAFDAHERSEYALSTPVFLSQADGICNELTGRQLYSMDRNTRQPRVAAKVQEWQTDDFRYSSAYPFTVAMPISADTRKTKQPVSELNRHAVLHGLSVDYDNRVNSCQAISLLAHVAFVFGSSKWDSSVGDCDAP